MENLYATYTMHSLSIVPEPLLPGDRRRLHTIRTLP
jgi:hypothetical protein